MDFGRAFTYIFQDPDWLKKTALTGLIGIIPIIGQLYLLGWGLEITRRIINGEPEVLPDVDFGNYLGKGFKGCIISLVYAIPIIILELPLQLAGPLSAAVELDQDTLSILMVIISLCCGGLLLLYSIFMAIVLPAAQGNFIAKNRLSAGFKFGEIFALVKAALVPYLLVFLGAIIAGFIAPLGMIACIVGVIITQAFSLAILGHLTGQAYREAAHKLGTL